MNTKNLQLTPWFNGYLKPVRSGLYLREVPWGLVMYNYYSVPHNKWYLGSAIKDEATGNAVSTLSSDYDHLPWRGLANGPD